jgi:hypothetical protein
LTGLPGLNQNDIVLVKTKVNGLLLGFWPGRRVSPPSHTEFFLQPDPVPAPGRSGPGSTREAGPSFKTMVFKLFLYYWKKRINVKKTFFLILCFQVKTQLFGHLFNDRNINQQTMHHLPLQTMLCLLCFIKKTLGRRCIICLFKKMVVELTSLAGHLWYWLGALSHLVSGIWLFFFFC